MPGDTAEGSVSQRHCPRTPLSSVVQVRSGLSPGASRIRTLGPTPSLAGRPDGSDPPHLPTQQIYRSRRGASGCERTAVLECRHSRFKRRLRAGWRFVVILNPMDQRPYRPIRGAARFLNSPLWSRVLRCTALPRIAYGGALTAALLLSRYVSLSLGRFHCGTGRLCEGWRTAPRQRDWWLSYGHHGRFLGGGSGYPPV